MRALQSGQSLGFGHEALRIAVATLLGAVITPILLGLTRRFPVLGPHRRRHILLHMASVTWLSFVLILFSCFLAAWIFNGMWLPSRSDIHAQLAGNWLLLIFAMCAFIAIAHAVQLFHRIQEPKQELDPDHFIQRVLIKSRTGQSYLSMAQVHWIETQGNYLALHVGDEVHLIRETLLKFEAQLDPAQFVRIHRRMVVAIEQIKEMQSLANGDTALRLLNGIELRASRNYRETILERWHG